MMKFIIDQSIDSNDEIQICSAQFVGIAIIFCVILVAPERKSGQKCAMEARQN